MEPLTPRFPVSLSGLLLALTCLFSGCDNPVESVLPRPTRWSVTPSQLEMALGDTASLTVTIFSGADTLGSAMMNGWSVRIESLVYFACGFDNCPLSISPLDDRSSNPQRFRLEARAVAQDTLVFRFGDLAGCPDPPECLGASWVDQLSPIRVPVAVRSVATGVR